MKWFYYQNDTVLGPVSETALTELSGIGAISPDTQVRKEDSEDWAPFADAFASPPQLPIEPSKQQQTDVTINFHCPDCSAMVSVEAASAGLTGDCPSCGGNFVIPQPGGQQTAATSQTRNPTRIKWIAAGAIGILLVVVTFVFFSVRNGYRQTRAAELIKQANDCAFEATGNPDWDKAVTLLEEAVDLRSHEAEFDLGSCYLFGRGVPQSSKQAVNLFRRSAEGGFAEGQYNLSVCYGKGDGVARNEEKMVKWLKLAADQKVPMALYHLGLFYLNGEAVPQDERKGIKLITSAANQGVARAQYQLSMSFEMGQGVSKDLVQACKWAILATRSGLSGGDEAVQELQSTMSAEQVAAAKRLARDWKP